MSETPRGRADTASAGALLVGAIILCAAAGLGIGAAVGATAPLAIAGGAIGLAVGFWLVISRFKSI